MSIANSPKLVLDMTLETLSHVLDIDCSWIQMISTENSELELVAHHGFHFKEQLVNIILDIKGIYQKEIIGLGNSLIINNLHRNKLYNKSTLGRLGYRWLVAVPMRNHRLAGVMSVASRQKRKIDSNFGDLITAVAGLTIMAHEKSFEKLKETVRYEVPEQNTTNNSLLREENNELLHLGSEFNGHEIETSQRETDLPDTIYSGTEFDRISSSFDLDIETIRHDLESIRNKLIDNYQTRRFTDTVQQNDITNQLLDQESLSSEYVTREEFNEFKESLKTFFLNTSASLDNL